MNEADVRRLLEGCAALDGLARMDGRRAVFCGAPPHDVDFAGYPRCIFDLSFQSGARRAGMLTLLITSSDECGVSLADMADKLREELGGTAFGGARAAALAWQSTREIAAKASEMRAPRLTSIEVEFAVHEFERPADIVYAAGCALGDALGGGLRGVYSADAHGERGAFWAVRLMSAREQDAWPGCKWRALDIALYLPGADAAAVLAAQGILSGMDRLNTASGAMLIDSARQDFGADECERTRINLRLRYNAQAKGKPADTLRAVRVSMGGDMRSTVEA